MDNSTINFVSYNPTGFPSIKRKWIRDFSKLFQATFIGIQEHQRKSNTIDKFFKDDFPDYNSYVIPGHRPSGQDNGRPSGGIAQLSHKSVNVKKNRIAIDHFRLQATLLELPTSNLLWINSYFPNDTQDNTFNENELLEVLDKIENCIENANFHDIIWSGDLNWHMTRNTPFSEIMKRFLTRMDLKPMWEYYECDYTHAHVDLKSFSTLDHFILNERLLNHIEFAGPIHLGDNLSRHSPIMLKLNIGNIPKISETTTIKPRSPQWSLAGELHVNRYTRKLHEKISNIAGPHSLDCREVHCEDSNHHSDERDSFVLNILAAMIETSHETIPLSGSKRPVDPDKLCKVEKAIPGWREECEPMRKDAVFWHAIWRSAGYPNKGVLHDIMVKTRNQYHYQVKQTRKRADDIRARKLFEASQSGSMNILGEMKKISGSKKNQSNLPNSVDGADGEDEIADKFKEVYSALYNSAGTEEAMNHLKNAIHDMIGPEQLTEVDKVTGAKVKEACCKMKPGKMDVSGGYSSDALLHGPDSLFDSLAAVFRSFLIHGTASKPLLACAFLPLLKGGLKDPGKCDSYRAIAGSSQILKLFDNTVLLIWGDLLCTDSLQFGFKVGTSTTQCSWLVHEVSSWYLRAGMPIILCTLDATKAFNKCKFWMLFKKLLDRKVPPIVVRLLIFIYEKQEAFVRWGRVFSPTFDITNGTRQGSVLSPAFFGIYLDDLLKELRRTGLGCHIAGQWYGAVSFADDLVLMAPTRTAMQEMLKVCERYGEQHNITFSTDPNPKKSKTKCLYMCGSLKTRYPAPVQLYGRNLPFVLTATHLGHELHQCTNMEYDANAKRIRFIDRSTKIRETFHFADPTNILQAVQVYAGDAYGAMIWDLYGENANKYFRTWNTCVKLSWDVPRETHTYFVDNLLAGGFRHLSVDIKSRYVKYFQGLIKCKSQEVRILAELVGRDAMSTTGKNLIMLERETGLSPWSATSREVSDVLATKITPVPPQDGWRLQCLSSSGTISKHRLKIQRKFLN